MELQMKNTTVPAINILRDEIYLALNQTQDICIMLGVSYAWMNTVDYNGIAKEEKKKTIIDETFSQVEDIKYNLRSIQNEISRI